MKTFLFVCVMCVVCGGGSYMSDLHPVCLRGEFTVCISPCVLQTRLRRQDVGLKTHLQQLDQQISELKLDVCKASTEHLESDSRPSSGQCVSFSSAGSMTLLCPVSVSLLLPLKHIRAFSVMLK